MARTLFGIVSAALLLSGCTTAGTQMSRQQQIENRCIEMGFKVGSQDMANCQLQLTQTAMSAAPMPMMMPPTVDFQPMAMPQRYGTQTVRVQANCSSYGMGGYVNTNCY